jgi:hypothetical protein
MTHDLPIHRFANVFSVVVAFALLAAAAGYGSPTETTGARTPRPTLVVRTSLEPSPAFFGDLVVAQVIVIHDARTVAPGSVQVNPSFAPYLETGAPIVSRSRSGGTETEVFRYAIQCLTDSCLPAGKSPAIRLPAVIVTATAGTQQVRTVEQWPATFVASRLSASDLSASAHFRRPTAMPRLAFGASPQLLADVLIAVAVILGVGGLAFVGAEVSRLVARRRLSARTKLTPLEAALLLARQAAGRPDPSDRRKAIGLLAKSLSSEGHPGLADSVGDIAWSEAPPSPERTLSLADEVEIETGTKEQGQPA